MLYTRMLTMKSHHTLSEGLTLLATETTFLTIRFFNSLSEGGVQLGPIATAATEWPIAACPG
jgi:hypothetical protein